MFLSFIVPVYNAEKYLVECLRSLLEQGIPSEEYEIICINDGSQDNSSTILQTFSTENANIVVINQGNCGVVSARNTGLKVAQGEYVWFVDADDFIKSGSLLRLHSTIAGTSCDRLIVGAYQFADTLTEKETELSRQQKLPINAPWYDAVVWRSLFRRSFLLEHNLCFRYPALTHGEDGLFMYEFSMCDPKDIETEEVFYFYREHSGSAETASGLENLKKRLQSHIAITKIMHEYYTSGQTDSTTSNKLMSSLWVSLYEISKLPVGDMHKALTELKQIGLFPYHRPSQCTITHSFMTNRTDWIGITFDKLYLHLHTYWGFLAFWVLHQLYSFTCHLMH